MIQGSQYVRMYGCTDFFTEIRKNVRNWESVYPYMTILTHVRINVNPYMGIRTSVHFTGIIV